MISIMMLTEHARVQHMLLLRPENKSLNSRDIRSKLRFSSGLCFT